MRLLACLSSVLLALSALALLFAAVPAHAGTVVIGTGSPGSCTEANLINALSGADPGDVVTFNCGAQPHTITLSSVPEGFIPPVDVSIDGGSPEQITLSGGGAVRLFTINLNSTITLTRLTLAHGYRPDASGGALVNLGTLVLDDVVIRDSAVLTPAHAGGAIDNWPEATLIIRNSTLQANRAGEGGAIVNQGALTITGSLLQNNSATNGGAIASLQGSQATLDGVSLVGNQASGAGGALLVYGGLLITSSVIHDNSAAGLGGGLYFSGTAYISDTVFSLNRAANGGGLAFVNNSWATLTRIRLGGNTAAHNGGGLYKTLGYVNLISPQVEGNHANISGGGFYHEDAGAPPGLMRLTMSGLALSGNTAGTGGGLFNDRGGVAIYGGQADGNSAGSGGAISNFGHVFAEALTLQSNTVDGTGGAISNLGTLVLANATVSGNSAGQAGGGLFNNAAVTATLMHVTLNGNQAASGGGLFNNGTLALTNSLVANSPSGGDCFGAITYDRYSLASDSTCGLAGPGSQNSADPLLSSLGNYGGPVPVHMPAANSPAVNGILGAVDVLPTDQRGEARPAGGGYDIGAVERQPDDTDLAPRLYLPVVLR